MKNSSRIENWKQFKALQASQNPKSASKHLQYTASPRMLSRAPWSIMFLAAAKGAQVQIQACYFGCLQPSSKYWWTKTWQSYVEPALPVSIRNKCVGYNTLTDYTHWKSGSQHIRKHNFMILWPIHCPKIHQNPCQNQNQLLPCIIQTRKILCNVHSPSIKTIPMIPIKLQRHIIEMDYLVSIIVNRTTCKICTEYHSPPHIFQTQTNMLPYSPNLINTSI